MSLHLTHLQKTRASCQAFSYLFLLTQMCDFPPFGYPSMYFITAATSPNKAFFPLHTTQGCSQPQPPQPALGRMQGRKGAHREPQPFIVCRITHQLLSQDMHTTGLNVDLKPALHTSSTMHKRDCKRHQSCVVVTEAFCVRGNLQHFMQ